MYSSQMLCVIAEKAARDVGPYLCEAFSEPGAFETKADFHDVVTVHDRQSQKRISEVLFASLPDSLIYAEESDELLTSDGTPKQAGDDDIVWYVDPIDGTSNFLSGYDHWCISIAAARAGEVLAAVIYQPTTRTLYRADDTGAYCNGRRLQVLDAPVTEGIVATEFPSARLADPEGAASRFMGLVSQARSVRRSGSTALALAEVASGHFLATFGLGTHPWDVAAGALLVERAGGKYLGFDQGEPYARNGHTAPNFVATGRADAALLCLQTAGHPDPQAAVDRVWGGGSVDGAAAGEGPGGSGEGAVSEAGAGEGQADDEVAGGDGERAVDEQARAKEAEAAVQDEPGSPAEQDAEQEAQSAEQASDGAGEETAEDGQANTQASDEEGADEPEASAPDAASSQQANGERRAAAEPAGGSQQRTPHHRPVPHSRPEGSAYWIGRPAPRGPHA